MDKFATAKYFISTAIRRCHLVAAFAVGVLIFACVYMLYPAEIQENQVVVEEYGTTVGEVLQPAYPEHIRIPSIGVDAPFAEPLGVDADREIEVPDGYEEVAYYKYGPTPGQKGPAVVLGHVDSHAGPAVFYSLGQLSEGDTIEIDREDGVTAIFEVEKLARHEQSGFPTREVYSDLDYAGLRLVTCTGTYDRGTQRYSHNLIVFAKLVSSQEYDLVPEEIKS